MIDNVEKDNARNSTSSIIEMNKSINDAEQKEEYLCVKPK